MPSQADQNQSIPSPPDSEDMIEIQLPDHRSLAIQRFGSPQGQPCFYLHGFPGSRLETAIYATGAAEAGLQLFAIDRPGYGRSSPPPPRTLIEWADDLAAAGDALGLHRFGLIGISGAGPYLCAAAYRLHQRVTKCLLISPLGPTHVPGNLEGMNRSNRILIWIARYASWLARPILSLGRHSISGDHDKFLRRFHWAGFGEADLAALQDPAFAQGLARSMAEAFQSGVEGALADGHHFTRPWGFCPEQVSCPVHLWHGDADRVVPIAMGRYLAEHLPHCVAHFVPGEGHLSLVKSFGPTMLKEFARQPT